MQVVAAEFAGGRVATQGSRREEPSPRPGLGGGAQLSGKRVGQRCALGAGRQISLVKLSDPVEVSRQAMSNRCGQGGEAVDSALPVAYAELVAVPSRCP